MHLLTGLIALGLLATGVWIAALSRHAKALRGKLAPTLLGAVFAGMGAYLMRQLVIAP